MHDDGREEGVVGLATATVLAAVALMAVALALTGFRGTRTSEVGEDGPVRFLGGEDDVSAAYVKTEVDQPVVFGGNVVENVGDEPVTLTRGWLSGSGIARGARQVEVRVLDPADSRNELVGAARWPYENFRELSRPLNGYLLRPHARAALLFIVHPYRSGSWQWRTTRLAYRTGGRDYQAWSSFGFMVCAPRTRACEPRLP